MEKAEKAPFEGGVNNMNRSILSLGTRDVPAQNIKFPTIRVVELILCLLLTKLWKLVRNGLGRATLI